MIFALFKSAKFNWGINHEALKKINKAVILSLLLYGAPVWKKGNR